MALAKRTLEISVQEITVPVTGAGVLDKTSHLLSAELIWPRVGIAQKAEINCKIVTRLWLYTVTLL